MKRNGVINTKALRPEYDLIELLQGGAVGKHAKDFRMGTKLALIEPHIRSRFESDQAVNDARRLVFELRKIGGTRRSASQS